MDRLRRMAPADWPAQDRILWQQACQTPAGLFDEAGAAHKLRPLTRRNYERACGVWLAYLADSSALEPTASPAARVTPERLDGWVVAMRALGRRNNTIRQYIVDLHAMLRLIDSAADLNFMMRPRGRPLSAWLPVEPKHAPPVDVADIMRHVGELHRHGLAAATPFARRTALRDAALLSVLATRAPRVSNLAMMRLGKHLVPIADGLFDVRFVADEMKGPRSLAWPLDATCSTIMRDYLRLGRDLFKNAAHTDAVWLGNHGAPLDEIGIAAMVRRYTLAWFGKSDGPHVMRKWLRGTAARRSPEAAFDAAEVCGHSVKVSLKHYAEASEIGAAMRYGCRLKELRQQTALLAERAFARNQARS